MSGGKNDKKTENIPFGFFLKNLFSETFEIKSNRQRPHDPRPLTPVYKRCRTLRFQLNVYQDPFHITYKALLFKPLIIHHLMRRKDSFIWLYDIKPKVFPANEEIIREYV